MTKAFAKPFVAFVRGEISAQRAQKTGSKNRQVKSGWSLSLPPPITAHRNAEREEILGTPKMACCNI